MTQLTKWIITSLASLCTCIMLTNVSIAGDKKIGESCSTADECKINYCENGHCSKRPLEYACSNDSECKEGKCFGSQGNRKCLLEKDSHCTVASNCSSGVCTNNKCT